MPRHWLARDRSLQMRVSLSRHDDDGSMLMPRDSNLPVREWLLGYGPAMPRRQFVRLCVLLCVPPASMTLTFALRATGRYC